MNDESPTPAVHLEDVQSRRPSAHVSLSRVGVTGVEKVVRIRSNGDEQLFYLMSRGLTEEESLVMVVNGFIEPFVKELPMEYAVELNRLIQLEMEGSVG